MTTTDAALLGFISRLAHAVGELVRRNPDWGLDQTRADMVTLRNDLEKIRTQMEDAA